MKEILFGVGCKKVLHINNLKKHHEREDQVC